MPDKDRVLYTDGSDYYWWGKENGEPLSCSFYDPYPFREARAVPRCACCKLPKYLCQKARAERWTKFMAWYGDRQPNPKFFAEMFVRI